MVISVKLQVLLKKKQCNEDLMVNKKKYDMSKLALRAEVARVQNETSFRLIMGTL